MTHLESRPLGRRAGSPATGAGVVGAAGGASLNPAAGVHARSSFSCEARCFCPCGDVVWLADRSGLVVIRCARTGSLMDTLQVTSGSTGAATFGSCMIQTGNTELWMGTTDGRIIIFNTVTKDQIAELRNLEAEKSGEVTGFALEGHMLFASYTSGRVVRWNTITKEMLGTLGVHNAAVQAITVYGGLCYAGDASGTVSAFDVKTNERLAQFTEETNPVTALLVEPHTKLLWVGRQNGQIHLLTLVHPHLARSGAAIVTETSQRITTMVAIGGKVWVAGLDRTTYVFHATTRAQLGKFRDHKAFIFQLGKLYTMETARVWSMSNDKTVNVYDAEGFFFPVHSNAADSEELFAAHATAQQLRVEITLLEKKLTLECDKVVTRDRELEKCRDEINKLLLKSAALQHSLDLKEEAIHGTQSDKTKLQDDYLQLNAKVSEMTMAVANAEHEKSGLRADLARAEEMLSRTRAQLAEMASKAAIFEAERNAVIQDKGRVVDIVHNKEDELVKSAAELRKVKDELVSKGVDLSRRERELEAAKQRIVDVEAAYAKMELAKKEIDDARRRLDDAVIVKDAQLRDLDSHLRHLQQTYGQRENDLMSLAQQRNHDVGDSQRLQDTFLLKSHQLDLVKSERENLDRTLQHERQQLQEARGSENRLKVQNDELRRQLELEKQNVKMLEDQYTIFQFVINSRGELINSVWGLHSKLVSATKALKNLEQGVQSLDPTKDRMTMKREWKATVVDRTHTSVTSVADVQKQVDYIISNYLSEYEKLHLGISTAKFQPDTLRPAVVGDQLLTKLRDVTLMKQFNVPHKPGTGLPPAVNSTLGPQHISVPVVAAGGLSSVPLAFDKVRTPATAQPPRQDGGVVNASVSISALSSMSQPGGVLPLGTSQPPMGPIPSTYSQQVARPQQYAMDTAAQLTNVSSQQAPAIFSYYANPTPLTNAAPSAAAPTFPTNNPAPSFAAVPRYAESLAAPTVGGGAASTTASSYPPSSWIPSPAPAVAAVMQPAPVNYAAGVAGGWPQTAPSLLPPPTTATSSVSGPGNSSAWATPSLGIATYSSQSGSGGAPTTTTTTDGGSYPSVASLAQPAWRPVSLASVAPLQPTSAVPPTAAVITTAAPTVSSTSTYSSSQPSAATSGPLAGALPR